MKVGEKLAHKESRKRFGREGGDFGGRCRNSPKEGGDASNKNSKNMGENSAKRRYRGRGCGDLSSLEEDPVIICAGSIVTHFIMKEHMSFEYPKENAHVGINKEPNKCKERHLRIDKLLQCFSKSWRNLDDA